MADLWLTGVPRDAAENPLPTLKAIRTALRAFEPRAGIEAAEAVLEVFRAEGVAHLGTSSLTIPGIREPLLQAGCSTAYDIDPTEYAKAREEQEPEPSKPAPEGVQPGEPAYKTAMLLMANLEGNPLKAASAAVGLARTTGAVDFYTEVVASMILTFPWLDEMLRQQKLLT